MVVAQKIVQRYSEGRRALRIPSKCPVFDAILGDFVFTAAAELCARVYEESGMPSVWMYRVDSSANLASLGATHTSDMPLWFGSYHLWRLFTGFEAHVDKTSAAMMRDLAAFVHGGGGAHDAAAPTTMKGWPTWGRSHRTIKVFGGTARTPLYQRSRHVPARCEIDYYNETTPLACEASAILPNPDWEEFSAWDDIMDRVLEWYDRATPPPITSSSQKRKA